LCRACILCKDTDTPAEPAKPPKQRKFKSARLQGEYEKLWIVKKDPRMKFDRIIFWGFAFVGLAIGFYLIYDGWASVDNPSVSPQLLEATSARLTKYSIA
jgi:hypothetical protein